MEENAMEYLRTITEPLTRGGVHIVKHEDDSAGQWTFSIVAPDNNDAGSLVGMDGTHANAIRTLMRTWASVNTKPPVRITVWIAKNALIKKIYIQE